MAYRDRATFARLIDLLTRTSIDYLDAQIRAGADCVQLFDSWAGSLPEDEFARWVVQPTRTMVAALKARHPGVPVIGFPRGAGAKAERYVLETGVDAVGCDTGVALATMRDELSLLTAVQGNLDPLLLVAGGAALEARVREIKGAMDGQRFVFNLGHGIVPETPPEHVARLVELVRAS
jgi:uroporphyrinogen decarboxylase